jgi:hypothetical protein
VHSNLLEINTMRDFAIHLSHKPGELGRVANSLARGGINIVSRSVDDAKDSTLRARNTSN